MSDTEDIQREHTKVGESQGKQMTQPEDFKEESVTESETESERESETESDTENFQGEQIGEPQPDDAERKRRQEDLNKKLLKAAGDGNNEEVIQHLSNGAEITSTDSDGDSGLHLSAQEGHMDVLQTFITKKVDINIRGYYLGTALMNAAHMGHLSCLHLLLTHGAATDLKDKDARTALMEAAFHGHLSCLQLILTHGAASNLKSKIGMMCPSKAEGTICALNIVVFYFAWALAATSCNSQSN